ncbi:ABC transporter permease [Sulfitobacter sp. PS-8MA]|uniref:ABC transporter permease n=1 Tax=Sulfitobacter sp. PS-8MA TaxID=3237707 RepID=UPI0034C5DCC8
MPASSLSYGPDHGDDLPAVIAREPIGEAPQTPRPRRSFASFRTISALMLREMSTRYGRTAGGYFWALLEPVAAVMIMAIGFSLLLRVPPLGVSFFLFYASGYLPFHVYQQIANFVARSITFSRPLLFYPAVTWIDAVLARFILNALTGIMVSAVTLVLIMVSLKTRTTLDVWPILLGTGMALLLGFGVGVVNCALSGLYPVWEIVWSIVTRPLFIASGVLFTYEDLPRTVQEILWYNPLLHVVGIFRQGIYPLYSPEYISKPYVVAVALGLMAMGLLLLKRYYRQIIENG